MTTYRAGVIGHTGRGNYGHGLDTVYLDVAETEIVAVADADGVGLNAAGERLKVPAKARYADYREMLRREKLDLVSVAPRWVDQHRDMVIAASQSGVKGIYCEKPLARTAREADEMVRACDENGVKIAVAHQTRAHPFIAEAKRMIADGTIGEIRELHGFGKMDSRGGGQDLMVLGTHILDLMCYFVGTPRWVQASVLQDGHDAGRRDARLGDEHIGPILGNCLHATYSFAGGVLGHFFSRKEGNRFANRSMGLHILGSDGILAYRGGYLMHYPHPCWTPAPSDSEWRVVCEPAGHSVESLNAPLVRDLIAAIQEDRDPLSSGRDARWSLEMILGVYAAHRNGRTAFPLIDRDHPLRDWVA